MRKIIKSIVATAAIAAVVMIGQAEAQVPGYVVPLRFGAYGGANLNFVGAGATRLVRITDQPLFSQPDLNDGMGVGYYFGATGEYVSDDILGAVLRLSVDDRTASMEDNESAKRFTAKMTYVTIEPAVRFNFGSSMFHLSAGPALAVNLAAKYDYDPESGDNVPIENAPIDNMNNVAFGLWGDFGADVPLNKPVVEGDVQWYLSPFLGMSYLVDQKKTDFPNEQDTFDDIWSTVTVRAGVGVKFGPVAW